MTFTRQQIENALLQLNNMNPTLSQSANQIVCAWSDNPTSIVQAMEIINDSENDNLIFAAACTAEKDITRKWLTYILDDRTLIRNTLCEKLISYTGTPHTHKKLISLIVAMALKDWPEEWPDCLTSFILSAKSPELCALDFEIISEIIHAVRTTNTITNYRRKQLTDLINEQVPNILDTLEWAIDNVGFDAICQPVSLLLETLCLTAPVESLFREGLLASLITIFAITPATSENSIKALTNLFINRSDAPTFINDVIIEVIQNLSKILLPDCNDQLLVFIMQFLTNYGDIVDQLCYAGDEVDDELVEWTLSVYRLILARPPVDEHCEEFWALWRAVLFRFYRSSQSKNRFESLNPCIQMFNPLLDEIRHTLYQAFESATDGGKLKSLNCQASWIFLASINKDAMFEFLLSQPASISMCYAIGLMDCCLSTQQENELLTATLPIIIAHHQAAQTIEMGTAVLYLFSHSIRFLAKQHPVLTVFGQTLVEFMNSPNDQVKSAACNSLFYVAMRSPALIMKEPNSIADMLYPNISDWIFHLSLKHSSKISKALANLASSQKEQETRQAFYERLYTPLYNLIVESDMLKMEKGLQLIAGLIPISLVDGESLYTMFIDPLLSLVDSYIQTQQLEEHVLTELLDTTVLVLGQFDFQAISQQIDLFVAMLLKFELNKEHAINSVAQLRHRYPGMEIYFELAEQALINPVFPTLDKTVIEAFAVLRFYRRFTIRAAQIESLLQLTTHFVVDEKLDVASEAAKLLKKILYQMHEEHNYDPLVQARVALITPIFNALTDTLHTPIFSSLSKALNAIFATITSSTYPMAKFDEDITQILTPVINDHAYLIDFSKFLRTNVLNVEFYNALKDFLVSTRCASISDKGLFKRELKLDALSEALEGLCSTDQKDAIKAEEFEILPALKQLSI